MILLFSFTITGCDKKDSGIKEFDANIYLYTKEEGGRSIPMVTYYEVTIVFKDTSATAHLIFSSTDAVEPGEYADAKVSLEEEINTSETEFTIKDGGRTIGKGTRKI